MDAKIVRLMREDEVLFPEFCEWIKTQPEITISRTQWHFRIGYLVAVRMIQSAQTAELLTLANENGIRFYNGPDNNDQTLG